MASELTNAAPAAAVEPVVTEEDQDLLDYAHGADLHLPGLIDSIRMNGALAGMVERQSRTIAANQLEIQRLRRAYRAATGKDA